MISIKTNSSEVSGHQDTFVALRGHRHDGHAFIPDAIARGAGVIVAEHPVEVPDGVELKTVPDTHEFLKNYLIEHYSRDFADMKLIGITGTNGKTTTCYLLYQLCQLLSIKCAYIGTIGFYCNGTRRPLMNTTPDILTLYRLLEEAKEQGCQIVVMEVSSHALAQERIAGLTFDVAGFTNLTHDHLDYHHDMAGYLAVKQQILSYLKETGTMLVNRDDPYWEHFQAPRTLPIGLDASGISIDHCDFSETQATVDFTWRGQPYRAVTAMQGMVNVYNFLFALGALLELGFSAEELLPLADKLQPPPGRLQTLTVNGGLAVIDYAHNPDAIYRVLDFYRKHTTGAVRTVIGSAGDRDRTKRPLIGEMVISFSDDVIFTNDDPHSEDPDQIFRDMIQTLPEHARYQIIPDRRAAIYQALDQMKAGDTTLILGKGHEDFIQFADKKIPHNDVRAVEEYLRESRAR